jgi:hypothetical protein
VITRIDLTTASAKETRRIAASARSSFYPMPEADRPDFKQFSTLPEARFSHNPLK